MEPKIMSHIMKGVIVSLVLIVIGIAGYFAGIAFQSWYSWTTNAIMAAGIIWGCIYYANQLDGKVTFGNIFAHGFKMSVVIALILIVYSLLSMNLLFPEMKDKAMEMARQRMEEKGNLSEDQIEQAMTMTKKFFVPFAIGGILLGTLFIGAIASVIGAAVAKKKPVNPLDQLNM
jgi:hypothetical protein